MKYIIQYGSSKYCKLNKEKKAIGAYKNYMVYECSHIIEEDIESLKNKIIALENIINKNNSHGNNRLKNKETQTIDYNISENLKKKIKRFEEIIELYNDLLNEIDTHSNEEKKKLIYDNPFEMNNVEDIINELTNKNKELNDLDIKIKNLLNKSEFDEIKKELKIIFEKEDNKIIKYLKNKFQDLLSSVRVYVRISDPLKKNNSNDYFITENNKNIIQSFKCNGSENVTNYDNFFEVYDKNINNKDLFYGNKIKKIVGIKDSILQCLDGYSIILFAYGYSGTGKTHSLIGGENNVLHNVLKEIKNKSGTAKIYSIKELYGYYDTDNTGFGEFKLEDDDNIYNKYKNVDISIKNYKNIIFGINNKRTIDERIKATPNNKVSSRSHLFITIEIKVNDEIGYLTLVDMAGIESPLDISFNIVPNIDTAQIFYNEKMIKNFFTESQRNNQINKINNNLSFIESLNYKKLISYYKKLRIYYHDITKNNKYENCDGVCKEIAEIIKKNKSYFDETNLKDTFKYIKNSIRKKGNNLNNKWENIENSNTQSIEIDGIKYDYKNFSTLIKESVFINESINHLSFFFKNKKNPKYKLLLNDMIIKNSKKNGTFKLEVDTYLSNKFIYNPEKDSDKIGMIPILKELENLGNKNNSKPSKFIMLALIRPDSNIKYCSGSETTLEFAREIKST
jgi:hypothetical protein